MEPARASDVSHTIGLSGKGWRRSNAEGNPFVEKLRQDWRGAPQLRKLDVRQELRGQGLQHDLRDPLVLATHGIPVPFAPRSVQDWTKPQIEISYETKSVSLIKHLSVCEVLTYSLTILS
eukprot:6474968-Amphidinium_carterae.1